LNANYIVKETSVTLYDDLVANGFEPAKARRAMVYSSGFTGDIQSFIRFVSEILAREDAQAATPPLAGSGKDRETIVSNHTGYGYKGSENFEHDDTGSQMNYSGVEDDVNNAIADHEGWEKGYDYD
jgi:hypothetical protein